MNTVLITVILVSIALAACCSATVLSIRLRSKSFGQLLRKARYASCLYEYLSSVQPLPSALRLLEREPVDRRTAGETIASLSALFSNIRADRKAEIERRYSIVEYFVQRAMICRGRNRSKALHTLLYLTPDRRNTEPLDSMRRIDRNSAAMLLTLRTIASPRRAAIAIGSYRRPLSESQIHDLTAQIIRRRVRLDWQHCLASRNPNLQRVGMEIVRVAAIVEAEEPLLQISVDADTEIVFDVLRTFASLRLPFSDRRIVEAVGRLDRTSRKRLYRIVIRNGYSKHALLPLVRCEQTLPEPLDTYLRAATDSFKHLLQ